MILFISKVKYSIVAIFLLNRHTQNTIILELWFYAPFEQNILIKNTYIFKLRMTMNEDYSTKYRLGNIKSWMQTCYHVSFYFTRDGSVNIMWARGHEFCSEMQRLRYCRSVSKSDYRKVQDTPLQHILESDVQNYPVSRFHGHIVKIYVIYTNRGHLSLLDFFAARASAFVHIWMISLVTSMTFIGCV